MATPSEGQKRMTSSSSSSSSSSLPAAPSKRMRSGDPGPGRTKPLLPHAPAWFLQDRGRILSKSCAPVDGGRCVVYWMSRDQRAVDNWALLYAQAMATSLQLPLHVVFNVVPTFLDATLRHFAFMLKGLQETEQRLKDKQIGFHLLLGQPVDNVVRFIQTSNAAALVTDMSPLRLPKRWVTEVVQRLDHVMEQLPVVQVDAHNIVPVWAASDKQEYAARTIRTKLQRSFPTYLTDIPELSDHRFTDELLASTTDWQAAFDSLQVDRSVGEVTWATPGTTAGQANFDHFIATRLRDFAESRNNPNKQALSNMSPWFHFGQVSVQRCVLSLRKLTVHRSSVDTFVEEAVVRRELAENYCYYNENYDNLDGIANWARETLERHWNDPREHVYTSQQLEHGQTHDDLWNAAQLQLTIEGKMHGFLRMYWAKKILEWTENPEEALRIAIYLNDKYHLDGRDPNGYVGCLWSIGGLHDQGWAERPIFGKIRYMNYQGCKRKFDIAQFVRQYPEASRNAAVASSTSR